METTRRVVAATLGTVVACVGWSGCASNGDRGRQAAGCDDAVVPTDAGLPQALHDAGSPRVVGGGGIWFYAPNTGHWGDLLSEREEGSAGKYPLWVGDSSAPTVTVRGVSGTRGVGRAELAPTAQGLPGPLPMGVEVPGPGCWSVTAHSATGTASITVRAKT